MARRRTKTLAKPRGAQPGFVPPALRARPRGPVLAAWRQRCLVGQAMALALWNAPAFAQNIITPDGRTQTNVSVSGTTTTITTQTIAAGAGYNSFSRFEQAAGTTVNMHLPQNTGALVNIVRDGPSSSTASSTPTRTARSAGTSTSRIRPASRSGRAA